ncbi:MAG: hypothetical protein Q8O88_04165 [bacterium]|nr:hypothetical protein [bacterium]
MKTIKLIFVIIILPMFCSCITIQSSPGKYDDDIYYSHKSQSTQIDEAYTSATNEQHNESTSAYSIAYVYNIWSPLYCGQYWHRGFSCEIGYSLWIGYNYSHWPYSYFGYSPYWNYYYGYPYYGYYNGLNNYYGQGCYSHEHNGNNWIYHHYGHRDVMNKGRNMFANNKDIKQIPRPINRQDVPHSPIPKINNASPRPSYSQPQSHTQDSYDSSPKPSYSKPRQQPQSQPHYSAPRPRFSHQAQHSSQPMHHSLSTPRGVGGGRR